MVLEEVCAVLCCKNRNEWEEDPADNRNHTADHADSDGIEIAYIDAFPFQ